MTHDPFTDDTLADDDQFARLLTSRLNDQLVVPAERQERVTAAARQAGRRRVRTRRIAAGAAVAAVAVGTVAVAPQLSHGFTTVQVAGQPSASGRPAPSASTPAATPRVSASAPQGAPSTAPLTQPQPSIPGELGILRRHLAAAGLSLNLVDAQEAVDTGGIVSRGTQRNYTFIGVYGPRALSAPAACAPAKRCRHLTPRLYVYTGLKSDKAGIDLDYVYRRPDGVRVDLFERTYINGNGPVIGTRLLIDDAVATAILTDPEWDRVAPLAR